MDENAKFDRRRFLRGIGVVGATVFAAGCSGTSDEGDPPSDDNSTPTGEETKTPEETDSDDEPTDTEDGGIDRPANYRWDLFPERNEELRDELGQYSEVDVGGVVEEHPSFEYSTESEVDNHGIDFNALKLYRESNYDILKESATEPMEELVEAFVDEDMFEEEKTEGFKRSRRDSPREYSTEQWLNAETLEESLHLGHNLIIAIDWTNGNLDGDRTREQAAIIREAYQRHHDFDVLAWTTNRGTGTGYDDQITGMMYSPDDDKIRSFAPTWGDAAYAAEGTAGMHTEIQDWPILEDDAEDFHPLLFHTDHWNRQNPGFRAAKNEAVTTITSIASDIFAGGLASEVNDSDEEDGYIAPTTGLTKQLTKSTLEYNNNDADFENIWKFSNTTEKLRLRGGNYVLDTVEEDDNYEGVFDGGVAVYKVDDEGVVEDVWADKAGEYDNFGQNYDELETSS